MPPSAPVRELDAAPDYPGESTGVALASGGAGSSSTRPSPSSWTQEAGVDTLRLLLKTELVGDPQFEVDELDGWRLGSYPGLSQIWAEGHPAPGGLGNADQVLEAAGRVQAAVHARFGVLDERGAVTVSRSDQTVTTRFGREQDARAFLAGMAAVQLPRTETTRRGHPVHSVSWTHPIGRKILGRCYDKGLEQGGEAFESVRLEDQRRYESGRRHEVAELADEAFLRGRFAARFGPVRKAVDGVKAATLPVVAKAIADEARYGYRDVREAERLAGALVLLSAGAGEAYRRSTYYSRRAELRDAGFVVLDDLVEAVEVNLGDVVEEALAADHWGERG